MRDLVWNLAMSRTMNKLREQLKNEAPLTATHPRAGGGEAISLGDHTPHDA
jgi:hypothetical protein